MDVCRDPVRLGRWCGVALLVWLVTDVVVGALGLYTIDALGGFATPVDVAQAKRADLVGGMAGICFVVAFLIAGILVLRWIFITNRNAHQWNDAVAITPGWAVGWFFVPLANLLKPFEGVSSVWRVSADPDDPDAVPVPARLRWWWGLWIATSLLGNISFRLGIKGDAGSLIASGALDAFTVLIDAPLVLVLRGIIRDLSLMQQARLPGA